MRSYLHEKVGTKQTKQLGGLNMLIVTEINKLFGDRRKSVLLTLEKDGTYSCEVRIESNEDFTDCEGSEKFSGEKSIHSLNKLLHDYKIKVQLDKRK